jgi:hypothetical protein
MWDVTVTSSYRITPDGVYHPLIEKPLPADIKQWCPRCRTDHYLPLHKAKRK